MCNGHQTPCTSEYKNSLLHDGCSCQVFPTQHKSFQWFSICAFVVCSRGLVAEAERSPNYLRDGAVSPSHTLQEALSDSATYEVSDGSNFTIFSRTLIEPSGGVLVAEFSENAWRRTQNGQPSYLPKSLSDVWESNFVDGGVEEVLSAMADGVLPLVAVSKKMGGADLAVDSGEKLYDEARVLASECASCVKQLHFAHQSAESKAPTHQAPTGFGNYQVGFETDREARAEEEEAEHEMSVGVRAGHIVGAAALVILVEIIGLWLPYAFQAQLHSRALLVTETLCESFAAGGFWGLALLHVMLEAVEACELNNVGFFFHEGEAFMNAAYALALCSYVFMLFVEQVTTVASTRLHAQAERRDVGKGEHGNERKTERKCKDADDQISNDGGFIGMTHAKEPHFHDVDFQEEKARERHRAATVHAILVITVLSIHSFMEGLIMGTRDSSLLIWVAAISIVGHKWAASLAISFRIQRTNLSFPIQIALLLVFVLATPLGGLIGIPMGGEDNVATAYINSLSAGILIYVAGEATRDCFAPAHEDIETSMHHPPFAQTPPHIGQVSSDVKGPAGLGAPQVPQAAPDGSRFMQAVSEDESRVSGPDGDTNEVLRLTRNDDPGTAVWVSVSESRCRLKEHDTAIYHRDDDGCHEDRASLDASFLIFAGRIIFLGLGGAFVFGMMTLHMKNPGHAHSSHGEHSAGALRRI